MRRLTPSIDAICLVLMAMLLVGCDGDQSPWVQGYVEAEFVHVASPLAGRVVQLHVQRGQQVQAEQMLFELDTEREAAAHAEAEKRLEQAMATLADLQKAQRPSEIAAVEAQLAEAQAALRFARRELDRLEGLQPSGGASILELEKARATHDQAIARVAQFESVVETARLGAREDLIRAAEADVAARQAALQQAAWNLDQKRRVAPQDGLVFDTLFRVGEQVPANQPVVTLLPPANIKVRAFVPPAQLSRIRVGDPAAVRVDGIADPMKGIVSFISPRVEYTPPVIYSRESRDKLVFMVEITFAPDVAEQLHPGQPVDVSFEALP